jgi:hypothetical protein
VQAEDVAHDRQADAGPPRLRLGDPVEAVEDFLEVFLRDPDPRVPHLHDDEAGLPAPCRDLDRAPLAIELDRVREEVQDDLEDLVAVRAHGQVRRLVAPRDADALPADLVAQQVEGLVHDGGQREGGRMGGGPRLLVLAREREQVVDHRDEAVDVRQGEPQALLLLVVHRAEPSLVDHLRVAANGHERGLQLVADVREEVRPHRVEPPQLLVQPLGLVAA